MLQPAHRLTLINAMRPPAGYRFDAAMAVTFTLDLRALLAAPAAFALTSADGITTDAPSQTPIELLHAIRAHAGNITVFSQAGEIALPPAQKVFAFLERCVVPVTAPRRGVVHPKVWVLRYRDTENPSGSRLRVLCTSRNLTFDTSWDTVLRIDESADDDGCELHPVAILFEALMGHTVLARDSDHAERVASLCTDLRRATFDRPAGVDDVRFHVLGLSDTAFPLPSTAGRSLVISPFVTNDFLTRPDLAKVDALVSSPESLDLLDPAALGPIDSVWAFDDGSTPDIGPTEEGLSSASNDPGRPLRGLHAKVFAFETGNRAQVFCGSANATGAAFDRNVEVLVELTGPVSTIGIDRLCDGAGDEAGLWSLFHTYIPAEVPPETAPDGPVDGIRRKVASLAIDGSVEESGEGWAVTYRTQAPMPHPPGVTVACWPLSTSGNRRTVAAGDRLDARFEGTLESISGFLVFEVAHQDSGTITRFVVPVNLTGLPADRDRHLMRSLIGSAERFLRYLLALLDEDQDQLELLDVIGRLSTDEPTAAGGFSLPVLEKMLRTMRRDPAKLLAIHPLVTDLAEDGALPPGFAELWATIHDVALESHKR